MTIKKTSLSNMTLKMTLVEYNYSHFRLFTYNLIQLRTHLPTYLLAQLLNVLLATHLLLTY